MNDQNLVRLLMGISILDEIEKEEEKQELEERYRDMEDVKDLFKYDSCKHGEYKNDSLEDSLDNY